MVGKLRTVLETGSKRGAFWQLFWERMVGADEVSMVDRRATGISKRVLLKKNSCTPTPHPNLESKAPQAVSEISGCGGGAPHPMGGLHSGRHTRAVHRGAGPPNGGAVAVYVREQACRK